MKGKSKSTSRGQRADTRAVATIEAAGWTITRWRRSEGGDPRFVARKQRTEDDDSVTKKFESALTLQALAKNVERREREEAR